MTFNPFIVLMPLLIY